MSNKILIVDDEPDIVNLLRDYFEINGYNVMTAGNGKEALKKAELQPDIILLDINMPDIDGLSVCKRIRDFVSCPILFLTAKVEDTDKINGFAVGGDDYIVKPFSNVELLLRVKSLLRRVQNYSPIQIEVEKKNENHKIKYQDLVLDLDEQSLKKGEEVIILTYTEFKILELFITHRKKIYSLENIYQSVWGEEAVGDSTIMVHIKNIRKKLKDNSRNPQYIKTAWGKGYYVD